MSLAPGRALSHYHLIEPIGEGGMGVVWKANDSTLGRDVAIKVLPDFFASDPERLARFEREARLLASLNHPHIASIFGFHTADDVRFLAMELVDGEDLAQRLQHGPVPLAEALPLGLQIAQALEHAHEKGVIHRDLKPANVKLTAGGQAKVLDFGLAKALEGDPSRPASSSVMSQSPTITGHLTGANVLLGTAAYMAPEQARGHLADKRADIWAFGAVMMEMLTGRRLFEGETISDTLASVLKTDPDWSALPKETPTRIRALLQRCLERNPKQRLRDIGEARILIEQVIAGGPEAPAAAPVVAASRRGIPTWMAAAGVAFGAVAMLGLTRMTGPARPETPLRKFNLAVPVGEGAAPTSPAVSPDGRSVAYVFGGTLWIQTMSDLEPRQVKSEQGPSHLFWSPDGKHLGYLSGTRIMKLAMDGGESQVVCDVRGEMTGGAGAWWGEDGTIAFSRADSGGLFRVPAVGGDPTPWIKPDSTEGDFHEPCLLPGGRGVLFGVHRLRGGANNITLWSGGKRKVLLELPDQRIAYPVYDPAGFILFARVPTTPGIWALPFSLSRLEVTGQPFLVVPGGSSPSISDEGTLIYLAGASQGMRQLAIWSRDGKEAGLVGQPEVNTGGASLAPDGRRIAWAITEGSNRDVWIFDTARGTRTRLTFDPGSDDAPSWSPSGDRIAYTWLPSGAPAPGGFRVLMRAADGTGVADTIAVGAGAIPNPDGQHLCYTSFDRGGLVWSVMEAPLAGSGTARELVKGNPRASDGRVSPSGNFLAYASIESGQWEVYLTRYPSCEGRWQVSTAGGQNPRWNAAGDRLFFAQADDIMEVKVSGTGSPTLTTPARLFTRPSLGAGTFGLYPSFSVSRDGSRFLFARPAGQQGPIHGVAVVQSWAAEFAKKR